MVSLFGRLASFAVAVAYLAGIASAAPANAVSLVPRKASKTQDTPAAPHFVIYDDKYVSGAAPDPSVIEGFNVYVLHFPVYHDAHDSHH